MHLLVLRPKHATGCDSLWASLTGSGQENDAVMEAYVAWDASNENCEGLSSLIPSEEEQRVRLYVESNT